MCVLTNASSVSKPLITLPAVISAQTNAPNTSSFCVGRSLEKVASPAHWTNASNFGMGWFKGHTLLSVSNDCVPSDVCLLIASPPER